MKSLRMKPLIGILAFVCGWLAVGLGFGCASSERSVNRYPSVSTNAIDTSKTITVPDKTPQLEKPIPRVK